MLEIFWIIFGVIILIILMFSDLFLFHILEKPINSLVQLIFKHKY